MQTAKTKAKDIKKPLNIAFFDASALLKSSVL
jgi:hypothetical protein